MVPAQPQQTQTRAEREGNFISNSPRRELWNENEIFWHNCERTEVDLPKGAAPQLTADAEPVADARLHGCGGSCWRSRDDGDDPGNQQKQTEPAMRESNGFRLMLRGDSGARARVDRSGGRRLGIFCSPFFPLSCCLCPYFLEHGPAAWLKGEITEKSRCRTVRWFG